MPTEERPPYRAAVGVAAAVLAVYVLTLAPTVTFWDAGEFIAAARTLGIPHPPGTPLFVMIAHAWGLVVPLGEFAYRTNLLSALFSASAAGFLFLVVHQSTRGVVEGLPEGSARALRLGGAAAAAFLGAFCFTNWQNSNETEVYTVATFTTAAMAWAAMLWRRRRHTERGHRFLLLIVYLAGISIGNHLLALLAVPGVLMFLVAAAGAWLYWKRKLERARWFLWTAIAAIALPYIAATAGWILTEMGRQPWIVQGLLLTSEANSPSVSTTWLGISLGVFVSLYLALGIVDFVLMRRYARPDRPAPKEELPLPAATY